MSLLDRVLTARPGRRQPFGPDAVGSPDEDREVSVSPWWQAPVAGALPAAGSWLLLALPALVVWVATAHTSVGWGQALGVASAGWFLGHGATVSVGTAALSTAPLGVWLVTLALAARSARHMFDRTERTAPGTSWPSHLVRRLIPGFTAGYAATGLLVWLVTLAGPARPAVRGLAAVLAVPVLSLAWELLRRHEDERDAGIVGAWLERLPRWLVRGVRPGIVGAAAALTLGVVIVAGMVVARWPTVSGLYAAIGAGLVGGVALTAGQLLLLPNLAVYALAWLAGPGFQIADGSRITLGGAHPGLMPMIPVLGALPSDATWPRWLLFLVLAPMAVGALVGWRSCRTLARLASWRSKAATACSAAMTTALALTVLAVLGSGSVGVDRLRAVGTSPLLFAAAWTGELLLGATAYVGLSQLRMRLRPHR